MNENYPNNNGAPQPGGVDLGKPSGAPQQDYSSFAPPPAQGAGYAQQPQSPNAAFFQQNNGYAPPPQNNGYMPPPPPMNNYDLPPQQPKKKSSCLIFAIIGAVVAVIALLLIVVAVALFFFIRNKDGRSSSYIRSSNFTSYLSSSSDVSSEKSSSSKSGGKKSSSVSSSESSSSSSKADSKSYSSAIDRLLADLDPEECFYVTYGTADLEWSTIDLDEDGIPEVVVNCTNQSYDDTPFKYCQLFAFDGNDYKPNGSLIPLPANDPDYPAFSTDTHKVLTCTSDRNYHFYNIYDYSRSYLFSDESLYGYSSVSDYMRNGTTIPESEFNRLVEEYKSECNITLDYTYLMHYDAPPQVEYIGYAVVNTEKDPLNMRSGPSKDDEVIFKVPKDVTVYVIEITGEWAYVDFFTESDGKRTGYVSTQYLKIYKY